MFEATVRQLDEPTLEALIDGLLDDLRRAADGDVDFTDHSRRMLDTASREFRRRRAVAAYREDRDRLPNPPPHMVGPRP